MYFVKVDDKFDIEYIYLIPLILSALVSLRSFRLDWTRSFKIFSWLLLSTVIIELFAIGWQEFIYNTFNQHYAQSNLWIYNAYIIIRHIFLSLYFSSILSSQRLRYFIYRSGILYVCLAIANYFYLQTPFQLNSYSIVLSNVLVAFFSVMFFAEILEDKKPIISLSSSTEVWLALGCLLYYSGSLPLFMLFNYLIKTNSALLPPLLFINDGLNFIMYSLFLTAFKCSPKIQK